METSVVNTSADLNEHIDAGRNRILVWDIPTRLFHWTLVTCFVIAYLTSESERWQLWHVTAGYTFGALLVFRLVWGVIGSRYARFSNFVRGPKQTMRYLSSLLTRHPQHYVGHNPAGAWAIVGMIVEIYLNSVEWGEGVFGAEAAAQHYFRKPASQLNAWEAARLAVMLPRPRYFEKLPNSPYLAERAEVIVGRMNSAVLP